MITRHNKIIKVRIGFRKAIPTIINKIIKNELFISTIEENRDVAIVFDLIFRIEITSVKSKFIKL